MESKNELKDCMIDLQEKYGKVTKLLTEDSKRDPITEPYRSQYAASAILMDMKSVLFKLLDNTAPSKPEFLQIKSMMGVVLLKLGTVSVDTEELSTGEEQLLKCVDILSDDPLKAETVTVILSALNQLGILWSERGDPAKAKEFLDKAESLYHLFSKESSGTFPKSISDIFNLDPQEVHHNQTDNSIEKIHTLTLYYLAQIYGNLNDSVKSALYCHTTLKRQLESKDFDPIDWALNAATLSQYFLEKVGFRQARHHLAAASYILDQYELNLNQEECNEDEMEAKKERFNHRSADVARCWAKYGLQILSSSKEKLQSQSSNEDLSNSVGALNSNDPSRTPEDVSNQLWFTSLELSTYEDMIVDSHVTVYDEARKVFLNAQEWLNKAKQYYSFSNCASDFIQIAQDMSQLYKYLAFFEDNEERQCRMHKRRIDNLEPIVKELNPQYYLLVCRQLWYELAEIYGEILDIKFQRMQESNDRPTQHAIWKVNHLAENSILNFTKFLDSLRNSNSKEMPKVFDEDLLRPTLLAYFHVGRLYGKMITSDKAKRIENMKKSIDSYKFLVDYCQNHEEAKNVMKLELGVCEDMAELLPLKVARLERELTD